MIGVAYRGSRFVARTWMRLFHRLHADGRQHVPAEGGVLLVANHASYLDPLAVGTLLRRPVRFLARSTLGRFAPFRWWMSAVGVVLVDRDGSPREGLAGAVDALSAGEMVCIFPEGTRSRTGAVAEFKRGALLVLKRAPVPVVPVGVEGSFAAFGPGRRLPRPARITVRYGAPMAAADVLAAGGVDELRRRVCVLAADPGAGAGSHSPKSVSCEVENVLARDARAVQPATRQGADGGFPL